MRKNVYERFEKYVDRSGGPDSCHLWNGLKNYKGYGSFGFGDNYRMTGAHRVAYILYVGSVPDGMVVMHSCDNPACVNHRHLSIGSIADNTRDAANKFRLAGSNQGLPFGARRSRNGFTAQLRIGGRTRYLGFYATAEEASAVAIAKKAELYAGVGR